MSLPFHPGELQAQALAGVSSSGNGIRDFMPDQHRDFFAALPFVLIASLDDAGAPHAGILSGAPGFVTSPDDTTLRISHADQILPPPGTAVGLLGLDFATRRRNRANGVVVTNADGATSIRVRQSFGNCPQHIRLRQVHRAPAAPGDAPHLPTAGQNLDARARALVSQADTFFVATTGGEFGIDISHRGGPPGFVEIDDESVDEVSNRAGKQASNCAGQPTRITLTVPDFNGNRFFNTLGNLLLDPRAALLFIDFDRGDVLELRGRAEVLWHIKPGAVGHADGRRWRFHLDSATWTQAAVPLRWAPLADPAVLR